MATRQDISVPIRKNEVHHDESTLAQQRDNCGKSKYLVVSRMDQFRASKKKNAAMRSFWCR